MDIKQAQNALLKTDLDGWLIYDFKGINDIAVELLKMNQKGILSRRYFYWIPAEGKPVKLLHQIEITSLSHLLGDQMTYSTWQELNEKLKVILKDKKKIAMEYSPMNDIPYVSKVDAGTLEMIKANGVEVVSSADILQNFTSFWTKEKYQTHVDAATILEKAAVDTWDFITFSLKNAKIITEYDVQQHILKFLHQHQCITDDLPNCSVNENSANPHYCPEKKDAKIIHKGDFILIDLWCKKNQDEAVYADITQVGIADNKPTTKQKEIFEIVKNARDQGTEFIRQRVKNGDPISGWEVDDLCRKVITDAGYGSNFIHRTGHNIDKTVHGNGAHLDNYETKDRRQLLPNTCFSMEPGIYLPSLFGIRLEYDIFIHDNHTISINGGIQTEIKTLF